MAGFLKGNLFVYNKAFCLRRLPAVRQDHAAADDGDWDIKIVVQLLQLYLSCPFAASIPAVEDYQTFSESHHLE